MQEVTKEDEISIVDQIIMAMGDIRYSLSIADHPSAKAQLARARAIFVALDAHVRRKVDEERDPACPHESGLSAADYCHICKR